MPTEIDVGACFNNPADERHQFALLRDPRAAAVSTFFHERTHHVIKKDAIADGSQDTIDEFVLAVLPSLCQWVAIRHILFAELLAEQSTIFWFEDAQGDPLRFHHEWLATAGLHLPTTVAEAATDAALRGDFNFTTKGQNKHPGEETIVAGVGKGAVAAADALVVEEEKREKPTWKDVLTPETVEKVDAIVRNWLPPAILAKIGVE